MNNVISFQDQNEKILKWILEYRCDMLEYFTRMINENNRVYTLKEVKDIINKCIEIGSSETI